MNETVTPMTRGQAAAELKLWFDDLKRHFPNHPNSAVYAQQRLDALELAIDALLDKQSIPLERVDLDVLEDLVAKAKAQIAEKKDLKKIKELFAKARDKTPLQQPIKRNAAAKPRLGDKK